ncbi:unnamed protein product [Rotaria sp. Silwood2]|nr:unnamed protein product [Rotaria sp. Silwood2]CAF2543613.1 unnamed protein product [Rotaria sp. Silwood2]CAF2795331.1 unnamed protein product [Rotaria sp. Silwood2]CAF2924326.1 unnamed protein product [Rotaria sp. Silwood2]CAF4177021.1 unnamed protein product [Rotaria sp. Silwood2]
MNYPYPTSSPYMQATMSQAVQAIMTGGALPPNCLFMPMPFQQAQQILPQLMMTSGIGSKDPNVFPPQTPYYNPPPYSNNPQTRGRIPQKNYKYPMVTYKNNNNNNNKKSKKPIRQQHHSNIYNSSSFDSYMRNLSWSRLFHRHPQKSSKQRSQDHTTVNYDKKSNSSKQQRSNSSTSSSSTTSDETIRRVNVTTKQSSNINPKQQTKGSLPFKYSSEFVPGIGKQQPQNIKSNDIFIVKKP